METTERKKLRDFRCSDTGCSMEWEELVRDSERDQQCCPRCGECGVYVFRPPRFWDVSPEARAARLKQRSEDHAAYCKKAGIHPSDATPHGKGSPEWRNQTRAKNTSGSTIDQLRYEYKHWEPGTQIIGG